ncbi:MAG: O-Antigen ligase [Gaiellaceae bacterium]|nr:O-Antigen ligase [Gaiellaceae bacterium]
MWRTAGSPGGLQHRVVVSGSGLFIAVFIGAGIVNAPKVTLAVVFAMALLAVFAVGPTWFVVPGLIIGTVAVPYVVFQASRGLGGFGSTPLSGQARLVLCVAAVVALRRAAVGARFEVPSAALPILAVFVAGIAISLATAAVRGTLYAGFVGDLYRQMTYPLAMFIGLEAGRSARNATARAKLYGSLALAACFAFALSIWYWGWITGRVGAPGVVAGTFSDVRGQSIFQERSIVPFIQDSPNGQAIDFALLAALAVPPLLFSGSKRSGRAATAVLVLAVAAILTTQSRTGIAAMAIAPMAWVAFVSARGARVRAFIGGAVLVVALIVGAGFYQNDRSLSLASGTFVARTSIWAQALGKFKESPVLGQGFHYSGQPNFVEPPSLYGAPQAHAQTVEDEYLGQAVDGGLVGFALFLAFLIFLGRLGLRLARTEATKLEGVAFLSVLSVFCVGMVSTAALQNPTVACFIWLALGLALGAEQREGMSHRAHDATGSPDAEST